MTGVLPLNRYAQLTKVSVSRIRSSPLYRSQRADFEQPVQIAPISLEGDLNTIEGLGFYAHAETPGLGGEVDNPRWKRQWVGKEVYNEDRSEPQVRLVKGGVSADAQDKEHKVDALSGATLTSRGVEQLVNYWMGDRGYAPFLQKLREGEV